MPHLRLALAALLAAATVLFAVGLIAERSEDDAHAEPAAGHAEAPGEEAGAPEDSHDQSRPAEDEGAETVLGVDLESTPLVVFAVLAGLGVAALAASRLARERRFLIAVGAFALAWAALDAREVVHQLDESHTAVAFLAMTVALLHVAAPAVAARLARRRGTAA